MPIIRKALGKTKRKLTNLLLRQKKKIWNIFSEKQQRENSIVGDLICDDLNLILISNLSA